MESFSKYLGLPIFLLLATWSAYETILGLLQKLNETRTQILMDCGSTTLIAPGISGPEFANHVLYADWVPMYAGLVLFMLIYTLVLLMIPRIVHGAARAGRQASSESAEWVQLMTSPQILRLSHSQIAGYGLGGFTSACTMGIVYGGWVDYALMAKTIKLAGG